MTVSQYRALHGKADSNSAPASAAAAATGQRGASAVPAPAPEGLPLEPKRLIIHIHLSELSVFPNTFLGISLLMKI